MDIIFRSSDGISSGPTRTMISALSNKRAVDGVIEYPCGEFPLGISKEGSPTPSMTIETSE